LKEDESSLVPTDYPSFPENVLQFPSIVSDDAPLIGETIE
jgi:hypothetical protein